MRVVHVYKDYDPPVHGGIEKHIATLGRFLSKRDIDVEVLCSRPPGAARVELDGAVRVQRCAPLATVASTPLPPGLPWRLKRSQADLVHLHYPWPPGEAAWWLAARDRPMVVTVHCEAVRYPQLGRLVAPLTRRTLASARALIVADSRLRAVGPLAAHPGPVAVVPYGIDLQRFAPATSPHDPLPGLGRPRIAFVGRLRHYKGLAVLAEALAHVPRGELVVVGDGPERSRFERDLRAAGVRDRTHFQGEMDEDDLIAILRDADVAVLPSTSRAEAFGLAIVEAQACGTPAVTTDVGTATSATVDDGRSGRVVPAGDPGALVSAIRWCAAPDGRAQRRAAARAHAERCFSAERMASEIAEIYARIA